MRVAAADVVLEISHENLQKSPESLLALAEECPRQCCVILKEWPHPDPYNLRVTTPESDSDLRDKSARHVEARHRLCIGLGGSRLLHGGPAKAEIRQD